MSGSTLLLLRHDITAANQWISNKLNQLKSDEGRASHTKDGVDIELDGKCADIENIISDSKFYFSHHRNHDPILKLSVDRLVKSWQVLTNLASNRISPRPPVEPLNLSAFNDDSESVSSYASAESNLPYTPRFEAKDRPNSARGRRFIPHLSPLYRAVIRAKVRSRGRRSVGSSTPSSLSVSPAASADPSPNRISLTSAATQTNTRETEITIRRKIETKTVTPAQKRSPAEVTLDPSDSEPEFEPFPWVDVSDSELQIDDLRLPESRVKKKRKLKNSNRSKKLGDKSSKENSLDGPPKQEDNSKHGKYSKHGTEQPTAQPEPISHSTPKATPTKPNGSPSSQNQPHPFTKYSDRLPQTTKPLGGNQQGLLQISTKPQQAAKIPAGSLSEDLSSSNDSLIEHLPKPGFALYSTLHIVPENSVSKSSGSSLSVEIPNNNYGQEKMLRDRNQRDIQGSRDIIAMSKKQTAHENRDSKKRLPESEMVAPTNKAAEDGKPDPIEGEIQQVSSSKDTTVLKIRPAHEDQEPKIRSSCPDALTTTDATKDRKPVSEEEEVGNVLSINNRSPPDNPAKKPHESVDTIPVETNPVTNATIELSVMREYTIDQEENGHQFDAHHDMMMTTETTGEDYDSPKLIMEVTEPLITRETAKRNQHRPKSTDRLGVKISPQPQKINASESEDERDFPTDDEEGDNSENERYEDETALDLSPIPYKNPPQDFNKTYRLDFTAVDESDSPRGNTPTSKTTTMKSSNLLVSSSSGNTDKENVSSGDQTESITAKDENTRSLLAPEEQSSVAESASHSPAPTTSTGGYNDSGFTDELETPDVTPRSLSASIENSADPQTQSKLQCHEQKALQDLVQDDNQELCHRDAVAVGVREKKLTTEDEKVQRELVRSAETEKERSSWWTRVALWILFFFFLLLCIPFLALSSCCDNSQYHCGMYGFRRKYTAIPPH